jgi:hypothetical protein
MSRELVSALVQLAISLGGAGLVVQILLLRQNRRKIAGEASASEANAASTLSGAALTMVENAQQDAREARIDAKTARTEADQARDETEKLWDQYNKARWLIHHLQMRGAILENALRQAGIDVPPSPEYDEQPPKAAPPAITDGPSPAGPPV